MREPEDFYTWDLWHNDLSEEIQQNLNMLDRLRQVAASQGRDVETFPGYHNVKNKLNRLGYGV